MRIVAIAWVEFVLITYVILTIGIMQKCKDPSTFVITQPFPFLGIKIKGALLKVSG